MDIRKDKENFKELLNNEYTWPAKYTFKFIVLAEQTTKVTSLFKEQLDIRVKPSRGGKYTSITIYAHVPDAETIVDVYQKASEIEGIISL